MTARRPPDAKPSWQECLDAGMTAKEAAAARGCHYSTAYRWASRMRVFWKTPRGEERFATRFAVARHAPTYRAPEPDADMDALLDEVFAKVIGPDWERG